MKLVKAFSTHDTLKGIQSCLYQGSNSAKWNVKYIYVYYSYSIEYSGEKLADVLPIVHWVWRPVCSTSDGKVVEMLCTYITEYYIYITPCDLSCVIP